MSVAVVARSLARPNLSVFLSCDTEGCSLLRRTEDITDVGAKYFVMGFARLRRDYDILRLCGEDREQRKGNSDSNGTEDSP